MSTLVVRGGLTDLNSSNLVSYPDNFPNKVALHNAAFNFKIYYTNSRTALSPQTSYDLWGVTYNKLSKSSTIYCRGYMAGAGVYNGQVGWYVRYGTSAKSWRGNPYGEWSGGQGNGNADNFICHIIHSQIAGYTTTGNQTFYVGWAARDGGANNPMVYWNPNNTNDARCNPNHGSILMLYEVEQ